MRPLLGLLAGTFCVVALELGLSFVPGGWLQGPPDATGAVLAVAGIIAWAAAGVGIGALCARISGRLEFPVAVSSGVLGLFATLFLVPETLGAVITSAPLLGLLAIGSALAFFRRRPDFR